MRVMPILSHNDILAALARGRDLKTGSAPWTLKFIERASTQFREWREVEIDASRRARDHPAAPQR